MFDRHAPLIVDAILPISEFLINHINKVSPSKKYLKIPGLTEFEKYDGIETLKITNIFSFVGTYAIRKLFSLLLIHLACSLMPPFFCIWLLMAMKSDMLEIKNHVSRNIYKDKIRIFSRLSEKELFTFYKNATALLIPLRPTFQDIARFPHKTGEYLASGNPVISTNYGEVKYYFTDGVNMLLAESYDINLFAEKMQFVIDHQEEAQKIGIEGKNMAIKLFDYRYKAKEIDDFLTLGLRTQSSDRVHNSHAGFEWTINFTIKQIK